MQNSEITVTILDKFFLSFINNVTYLSVKVSIARLVFILVLILILIFVLVVITMFINRVLDFNPFAFDVIFVPIFEVFCIRTGQIVT